MSTRALYNSSAAHLVCLNLVVIDTCSSSSSSRYGCRSHLRYTAAAACTTAAAVVAVHTHSRAMRSACGWAVTAVRVMQQWQLMVCLQRSGGSGSSNPTAVACVHTQSSAAKLGGCAVSLVAASGRRRRLSPKHAVGGRTKSGFSSCCGARCR
jgi:hypothetical protein